LPDLRQAARWGVQAVLLGAVPRGRSEPLAVRFLRYPLRRQWRRGWHLIL